MFADCSLNIVGPVSTGILMYVNINCYVIAFLAWVLQHELLGELCTKVLFSVVSEVHK